MWDFFLNHWRDGVEILIMATLIYYGYLHIRATRAARILIGLLVLLLVLTLLSNFLELEVIGWLIKGLYVILAIALVVLFQPELRRGLARLGSHRLLNFNLEKSDFLVDFQQTVTKLSKKRYGALFAFERGIDLTAIVESGTETDAQFSEDLVMTLFHPRTALHDGGLVITRDRIRAAGCIFPLSQREMTDRSIGLRHRAGIGITEETDAVAVVVSEESGQIALCYGGKIEQNLKPKQLAKRLNEVLTGSNTDSDNEETSNE